MIPFWEIRRTDTFLREFRKYKKNMEFVHALENKILRLMENPLAVGGFLAGPLHGKRSTRILKRFRIIFLVDEAEHAVYLESIDHRGSVYDE